MMSPLRATPTCTNSDRYARRANGCSCPAHEHSTRRRGRPSHLAAGAAIDVVRASPANATVEGCGGRRARVRMSGPASHPRSTGVGLRALIVATIIALITAGPSAGTVARAASDPGPARLVAGATDAGTNNPATVGTRPGRTTTPPTTSRSEPSCSSSAPRPSGCSRPSSPRSRRSRRPRTHALPRAERGGPPTRPRRARCPRTPHRARVNGSPRRCRRLPPAARGSRSSWRSLARSWLPRSRSPTTPSSG